MYRYLPENIALLHTSPLVVLPEQWLCRILEEPDHMSYLLHRYTHRRISVCMCVCVCVLDGVTDSIVCNYIFIGTPTHAAYVLGPDDVYCLWTAQDWQNNPVVLIAHLTSLVSYHSLF